MIILHEKLYQNQDVTYINTSEYISNLIVNVNSSYSIGEKVEFILETDNIKLSLDTAVPLGLILNEVLTNCFKYAFKNISDPRIVIVLKIENELLLVCIHDNGIGISDINQVNNKSFGYKLIHSLCRQLDAELKISNNNGTLVELQIKDFRLYE
jgi:two-component sensor histidine kinase